MRYQLRQSHHTMPIIYNFFLFVNIFVWLLFNYIFITYKYHINKIQFVIIILPKAFNIIFKNWIFWYNKNMTYLILIGVFVALLIIMLIFSATSYSRMIRVYRKYDNEFVYCNANGLQFTCWAIDMLGLKTKIYLL